MMSAISTGEGNARGNLAFPLRLLVCALALAFLTLALLAAVPQLGQPQTASVSPNSTEESYPPAPEIEGIAAWLNSESISLNHLQGRVVLIDFWTYTCVNCIRTIPQLRQWNDRYSRDGLVVIGIHTPEFEFEKNPDNVREASLSLGVTWPIALDNDYVTWDNFGNAFWPTKYLIDSTGRLRYHRIGEGNYETFEERLRSLLVEAGADLSAEPTPASLEHLPDPGFEASPDGVVTRELYAGYERGDFEREYYGRGYVGQPEYYGKPDQVLNLEAPDYLEPDMLYFQGLWRNQGQQAVHARETTEFEDHVELLFSARTVNGVLAGAGPSPSKVIATLDGEYLTEENRGADVVIGEGGESYLLVNEARMYQVVDNPEYTQRWKLRLSVNSEGFAVYAFTFGIYAQGP